MRGSSFSLKRNSVLRSGIHCKYVFSGDLLNSGGHEEAENAMISLVTAADGAAEFNQIDDVSNNHLQVDRDELAIDTRITVPLGCPNTVHNLEKCPYGIS